jgi:hypothetical protein
VLQAPAARIVKQQQQQQQRQQQQADRGAKVLFQVNAQQLAVHLVV